MSQQAARQLECRLNSTPAAAIESSPWACNDNFPFDPSPNIDEITPIIFPAVVLFLLLDRGMMRADGLRHSVFAHDRNFMVANRRAFVGAIATTAIEALLDAVKGHAEVPRSQPQIPLWRGFNLTELLTGDRSQSYQEADFEWITQWGFNFVRLPCSYWTWSDKNNWKVINEKALLSIDRAIEFGRQYGISINLCLHRIPGYCVSGSEWEPYQLFNSSRDSMERALEAAVYQWRYFAQRYSEVPSTRLSFNLFNEPPFMTDQSRYVEIALTLTASIREVDPQRLIFVDGTDLAQTPVIGLADQGIVQSTRGYLPKMVSHYGASWVPANEFESFATPTWPMTDSRGVVWDRGRLNEELIAKWQPLTNLGVPVHVGEWGCFNRTPRKACLGWMSDLLSLWKKAGWGWAMWNLRGAFGVVDSDRPEVTYENFHGHLLDREMLTLLVEN